MKKKKKKSAIRPLNIPKANTYELLKVLAKTDNKARIMLRCMDRTLHEFKVLPKEYSQFGDMILRYAMLLAIQDHDLAIDTRDKALVALTDAVEYYNKLTDEEFAKEYELEEKSKEQIFNKVWPSKLGSDGQHRLTER